MGATTMRSFIRKPGNVLPTHLIPLIAHIVVTTRKISTMERKMILLIFSCDDNWLTEPVFSVSAMSLAFD
jgi:hypothetical protein